MSAKPDNGTVSITEKGSTMLEMKRDPEQNQGEMEQSVRAFLQAVQTYCGNTLNAMIHAEFEACDRAERTLTLSAVPEAWMVNPMNTLHGGISATYMDFAMGVLCRYFAGKLTPTIQMNTNYTGAIPMGETLHIKAKVTKPGKRILFTEAVIVSAADPGRVLASATGTYYAAE